MRTIRRERPGFTLVELLVAVALVLFIMVIMTNAFQSGLDAFRNLRAAGDMQGRLRGVADVLRRDLSAPHFDGPFQPGLSGPNLSDQRLDRPGWMPPAAGFFRIWQGPINQRPSNAVVNPTVVNLALPLSAPGGDQGPPPFVTVPDRPVGINAGGVIYDGNPLADSDSVASNRAWTHILHFTAQLSGQRRGDFFAAGNTAVVVSGDLKPYSDPANGILASRWGEIVYFLRDSGERTASNLPRYTLFRKVRVVPDATTVFPVGPPRPADVSPDLATLTYPPARMGVLPPPNPPPTGGRTAQPLHWYDDFDTGLRSGVADGLERRPLAWDETASLTAPPPNAAILIGEDILLTDVLSFEVRATWTPHPPVPEDNPTGTGTPPPIIIPAPYNGDPDYPFDDIPFPDRTQNFPNTASTRVPGDRTRFVRNQSFLRDQSLTTLPVAAPRAGRPPILPVRCFDTWTRGLPAFPVLPNQDWNNSSASTRAGEDTGYMRMDYEQVPLRIRITALQIRIKVWNQKTQQARQITIVQDM